MAFHENKLLPTFEYIQNQATMYSFKKAKRR